MWNQSVVLQLRGPKTFATHLDTTGWNLGSVSFLGIWWSCVIKVVSEQRMVLLNLGTITHWGRFDIGKALFTWAIEQCKAHRQSKTDQCIVGVAVIGVHAATLCHVLQLIPHDDMVQLMWSADWIRHIASRHWLVVDRSLPLWRVGLQNHLTFFQVHFVVLWLLKFYFMSTLITF